MLCLLLSPLAARTEEDSREDAAGKGAIRERIRERLAGRQPAPSGQNAPAAEAPSAPDAFGRQTFIANGVKLSYAVEGKGEPVILIHGLYASYFMNWQLPGIAAALARDYQVIGIDMPGHGSSDKPDNDAAYGVEMVEDVVRLMDTLKIKKAHIVGYSMGGMIAAKLVTRYPDRVSSCVLGGMGWLREGSFLQKFWELGKGDKAAKAGGGGNAIFTPLACPQSFGKLAISDDELKAIRVPLTVLVGDQDPCKFLYVNPLQEARKDISVVIIENAGHLDCVVKPQFKDEIKKWLDKQPR